MKPAKGLKIREIAPGSGRPAVPGDAVIFDYGCRLNHGDPVEALECEGIHRMKIGERNTFVGLEHGALGMRSGGIREIRVSPQLTHMERKIFPDLPEGALIHYTLRVHEILDERDDRQPPAR